MARTKGGEGSKNEKGLPLAVSVTSGTVADCSEALSLIENLKVEGLIADRAYDTSFVVALPFGQIISCRHSLENPTNFSKNEDYKKSKKMVKLGIITCLICIVYLFALDSSDEKKIKEYVYNFQELADEQVRRASGDTNKEDYYTKVEKFDNIKINGDEAEVIFTYFNFHHGKRYDKPYKIKWTLYKNDGGWSHFNFK